MWAESIKAKSHITVMTKNLETQRKIVQLKPTPVQRLTAKLSTVLSASTINVIQAQKLIRSFFTARTTFPIMSQYFQTQLLRPFTFLGAFSFTAFGLGRRLTTPLTVPFFVLLIMLSSIGGELYRQLSLLFWCLLCPHSSSDHYRTTPRRAVAFIPSTFRKNDLTGWTNPWGIVLHYSSLTQN